MIERTKMIPEDESGSFGTVDELTEWMQENGVPSHAKIIYAGCGTHSIEFVWDEEQSKDSPFSELGPFGEDLS